MYYIYYYSFKNIILYVGSTDNPEERHWSHISDLKRNMTIPFYIHLRENKIDFSMLNKTLIEVNCNNKIEMKIEEDRMITILRPYCNMRRAYVSEEERKEYKKQYRTENKEHLSEKNKQYYIENKEHLNENQKQYQKLTIFCEICKEQINKANKSHHNKSKKHIKNSQQN